MKSSNIFRKIFRTALIQNFIFFSRQLIKKYRRPVKIFTNNKSYFKNKSAIEIGGPTKLFEDESKIFPIYSELSSIDNCNYNENNFWSQLKDGDEIEFNKREKIGKQIVADASDLSRIKDASYDLLINSHVIEHIANPIKALFEWKRVIKNDGIFVMVVPNKEFTYDNKRPVTKFEHIVEDYTKGVEEDDSTHFEEVIQLHDLEKDTTVKDYHDHYERTMDNFNRRIVHHHVFDTELVVKIVEFVGFEILGIQKVKPFHIIVVAKNRVQNK